MTPLMVTNHIGHSVDKKTKKIQFTCKRGQRKEDLNKKKSNCRAITIDI